MAASDVCQTFTTRDGQIVAECCDAMRIGSEAVVLVDDEELSGFVRRIELVDDGQHRITIRLIQ